MFFPCEEYHLIKEIIYFKSLVLNNLYLKKPFVLKKEKLAQNLKTGTKSIYI